MVRQGDLWLVRFDPTVGSEIQKTRPAIVISPRSMNDHLHTVIVAPMTTGSRSAPFRVPVRFSEREGLIVLDHIRSVDKRRLVKRLGEAPADTLERTLAVTRNMFE